ncbi:hypothetical protein NL676_027494 [Syzygium grande]|nr:hypothetical protein NL676_027494 [Syzygium grande]
MRARGPKRAAQALGQTPARPRWVLEKKEMYLARRKGICAVQSVFLTTVASAAAAFAILSAPVLLDALMVALAGNFRQEFDITWGDGRAQILDSGDLLTLSLSTRLRAPASNPRTNIFSAKSTCNSS